MAGTSSRLLLGFAAGALSHVVFQGALGVIYYGAGMIPGLPWGFEPLPPFGVPRTVNFAFWAGLWGIAYAAVEPRLTPRLGVVGSGLLFGVAALLVRWLIVLPLKGEVIAEGFVPNAMIVYVGFHLIFGIGLALLLAGGLALLRPQPEPAPRALRR